MKLNSFHISSHWLFLIGLVFFLVSCTEPPTSGGNSLETENSIALQINDFDGAPLAYAQVLIRPSWFVADTTAIEADSSLSTRNLDTDSNGHLLVQGLPAGAYVIEARRDNLKAIYKLNRLDTSRVKWTQEIVAKPTGVLKGRIPLAKGASRAWVQVYGLDYVAATDSLGYFEFDSLPSGIHLIRSIVSAETPLLAEDLTEVFSEKTVDVGLISPPSLGAENPNTWKYNSSIALDSLVPDWSYPLYDSTVFTLRLNSSNFDFSTAAKDGSDLRIETSWGKPLAFNIRRWESKLKRAVVRIRIQREEIENKDSIHVRWGRSNAINRSIENVWEGIPDSTRKKLNSVLISDFENQSKVIAYPEPIAESYWYRTHTETATTLIDYVEAGGDREGYAAHYTYSYEKPEDWSLMGTYWDGHKSIATLDSIVFWAKGDGKMSVSFDQNADSSSIKSWVHLNLNAEWTHHSFKPSDLLPEDNIGGNVGWLKVRDSISNISFFGHDGTGFWLDDITLHGVDRDDLK